MVLAHLHRIDPDANMARFYCIDLTPTLFGEITVLRHWGRIGTCCVSACNFDPLRRGIGVQF